MHHCCHVYRAKTMSSARSLIAMVSNRIQNSDNPLFEARLIIGHFVGVQPSRIMPDMTVDSEAEAAILAAADRRADGYPLQYILGEWEFYGLSFYVGEGVLIPRADTETLIEVALQHRTDGRVLDLCSGSGCVAIAIAHRTQCEVVAVEKSEQAYSYLVRNIARNHVDVTAILGDALQPDLTLGNFDMILSNPPYLTSGDMTALQREVQFEPAMALHGETDGLYFYRELTRLYYDRLNDGGMLAYEIGMGQESDLADILLSVGFKTVCNHTDLCGIIRVVSVVKSIT